MTTFDLVYGFLFLLAQIFALIIAFRIIEKLKSVIPTSIGKSAPLKILLILAVAGAITLPFVDAIRILLIPAESLLTSGNDPNLLLLTLLNSLSILLVYPISIYIFANSGIWKLSILQRLGKFDRTIAILAISGLVELFVRNLILENLWSRLSSQFLTATTFYSTYIPGFIFGILVCFVIIIITSIISMRRI